MTDIHAKRLRRLANNGYCADVLIAGADRIEELNRELAKEKQYFKEVNEKAWDVHGRVHQLEQRMSLLLYTMKSVVSVPDPREWRDFCEGLIAETEQILRGEND